MKFKQFLFGQKDIFGLDIGSTHVKSVQLVYENDRYKILSAGLEKIEGKSDDPRDRIANLMSTIRRCAKSMNAKTKYAVCGICGSNVAVRPFRLPALEDEEIENAVIFEAEQVCPFDKGKFIVDYDILYNSNYDEPLEDSDPEEGIMGVLVAATMDIIGSRNQLVRGSSLSCVTLDADGLALLNCFSGCEHLDAGSTIGIIDVGSMITNLAIRGDKGLPFVRDISHAGDEIINNLATIGNISSEEVVEILHNDNVTSHNHAIIDDLEQASSRLIDDISETLRFSSAREGHAVDKLLVCGGFAHSHGFVELLNNNLRPDVVLWNPLSNMQYAGTVRSELVDLVEKHGPSLALSTGLAMRSI